MRHAKLHASFLIVLTLLLIVFTTITSPTVAHAENNPGNNLATFRIKTIDTQKTPDPGAIDRHQGQYIKTGTYRLYYDKNLENPVHFTHPFKYVYIVADESKQDTTIDIENTLGVLNITVPNDGTYYLQQTQTPDGYDTISKPIELHINYNHPTTTLTLDKKTPKRITIETTEHTTDLIISHGYDNKITQIANIIRIIIVVAIIGIFIKALKFDKNRKREHYESNDIFNN